MSELKKQIGMIGLGKMGANMARHLVEAGWEVIGYNRTAAVTQELEKEGVVGAYSLSELKEKLTGPRIFWVLVPAGAPVDEMIFGANNDGLLSLAEPGDIIIDGGNSYYQDAIDRFAKIEPTGVKFMDVGVSGGPGGARNGACLMIGGDQASFDHLEPLFQAMTINNSYQFFPGVGAGHFAKMIHNGIEYGMMQAIAEGMAVLKASPFNYNLTDITKIYNNGSVIESRLVGWLKSGYEKYGEELEDISSSVNYTGEGEWTVNVAKKLDIPVPVIEDSFQFRVQSAENPSYIGKVLTLLRNQFGGHSIEGRK